MNKLTNALNRLSDNGFCWWPFISWKPKKTEKIEAKLIFKLTAVFGTLFALIQLAIAGNVGLVGTVVCFAVSWLYFCCMCKCLLAWPWNIRAERLHRK